MRTALPSPAGTTPSPRVVAQLQGERAHIPPYGAVPRTPGDVPPAWRPTLNILQNYQSSVLASVHDVRLHGVERPTPTAHPVQVLSAAELLRIPGFIYLQPDLQVRTLIALDNIQWSEETTSVVIDRRLRLRTEVQELVDTVQTSSPAPAAAPQLDDSTRAGNAVRRWLNLHPDAVDLEALAPGFPGLDATSPTELTTIEARTGASAAEDYLADLQDLASDGQPHQVSSRARDALANLAAAGQQVPTPPACSVALARCVQDTSVLRIPDDQVDQVRGRLVTELTSDASTRYGLPGPLPADQAQAWAGTRVQGLGFPLSLTELA